MSHDPAKARFFAIQLMRLGGVVMALLGIAVIYGKVALPYPAGVFLFLAGLAEALFVPTLLARRWKTRD